MSETANTRLVIEPGRDKSGQPEPCGVLEFEAGQVVALVGPTGSGKTRMLSDIERCAAGDSPTGRRVSLTGVSEELIASGFAVGRISQTMQFFLDLTAREFIRMHRTARGTVKGPSVKRVMGWANRLAGEPLDPDRPLAMLSGGQARALMVSDMVLVSDAPVLLIDEIENAGIDRHKALDFLIRKGRLVIVATHDPLIALRAGVRLVLSEGAVRQVLKTSAGEKKIGRRLARMDREIAGMRDRIRDGEILS